MGCYGIGITRIVAAAIEQNHDQAGIIWPAPLAPFQVAIVAINADRSERVAAAAHRLHEELEAVGLTPFLDDRPARPGVKFADMELIGIPHRLVVGERGLDAGHVEYRSRRGGDTEELPLDRVVDVLKERCR
jgi:prolyl-tRNA synthetase